MPESRVETKVRLLMELTFIVDVPRRMLLEPNSSPARVAVAQATFSGEFSKWTADLQAFITFNGHMSVMFWNRIHHRFHDINDVLMSAADTKTMRSNFDP